MILQLKRGGGTRSRERTSAGVTVNRVINYRHLLTGGKCFDCDWLIKRTGVRGPRTPRIALRLERHKDSKSQRRRSAANALRKWVIWIENTKNAELDFFFKMLQIASNFEARHVISELWQHERPVISFSLVAPCGFGWWRAAVVVRALKSWIV